MHYKFYKTGEWNIPELNQVDVLGVAVDESGKVVAEHISSNESWLVYDLKRDIPIQDTDTYELVNFRP